MTEDQRERLWDFILAHHTPGQIQTEMRRLGVFVSLEAIRAEIRAVNGDPERKAMGEVYYTSSDDLRLAKATLAREVAWARAEIAAAQRRRPASYHKR